MQDVASLLIIPPQADPLFADNFSFLIYPMQDMLSWFP
jgi:hypothetical protein